MERAVTWLAGLPPAALYAALALTAAVENIFPPFPADTVVAVGSFLAARGQATLPGAFLATWLGNVAGAMAVFAIARRLGGAWAQRFTRRFAGERAEHRLEHLHGRYGMLALFLSRFLPAARAVVPPFAGAMQLPAVPVLIAIAIASGIWYGLIAYAAYSVGTNLAALNDRLASLGRWAAAAAALAAVLVLAAWLVRRRRA